MTDPEIPDNAIADFVRKFFDDIDERRRIDTLKRAAGAAYIRREAEKTNKEQPND